MNLRVVLDTNVVVSALLFDAGRLAWLRHAWQQRRLHPLVCQETIAELRRVLAYPKFKLTPTEQQIIVGRFLALCRHGRATHTVARLADVP